MTPEHAQAGAAIILADLRQKRIRELARLRHFELIAGLFQTGWDPHGRKNPAGMTRDQLITRILHMEGHTP